MAERAVRVAHINTEAASWIFFTGQGKYMQARGIDFHCVSSPGEFLDRFAACEGITPHVIRISRTISPLRDLVSTVQLWRKLRTIRPDIVQAHTTKAGLVGMLAAWLARVPARIYHNHGMPLLSAKGYKKLLLRWSDKLSCLLAHRVIYVAPSVRNAALADGLCEKDKMKVILSINGLDTVRRFNPAKVGEDARMGTRLRYGIPVGALVVGFVGRIFRVKGVVELMAAWESLSKHYDSLHMLVVGAFDSRDPVPSDVQKRMLTDPRIHLTGYVDDMPPLYAAMDLLVLPSHHEGLGYVLLEASAMELPVVGTRIPGILDAVRDGVTGLLVEPGDPEALADAVTLYLEKPGLRREHGRNGREYVSRNFRQEQVWEALYAEYQELLGKNLLTEEPIIGTSLEHTR